MFVPAHPVLTLTGNLLWEHTLVFNDWAPGHTQRATSAAFQVGGKGTNVSRALAALGCPNTALVFPGGTTGAECEAWLRGRAVDFRSFPAASDTRIGFVVRGGGQPETTFLGPDAAPGGTALRACAEFLDAQPDGGLLAVCGSLPGWPGADFDPLRTSLERWLGRGSIAVDTYGPPLAWFAARPVSLVKVNRLEFDGMFSPAERAEDVAVRLGRLRTSRPVSAWVVTDGPGPVWWVDGDGGPSTLMPPSVTEVSATGSGDVLFASLLQALWRHRLPLADALVLSLPRAAAHAAGSAAQGWSRGAQNR
jgi:fructose-1-phosphate kinase PfkB-like protein